MGLGNFSPDDDEEATSSNQSTYVTFKNKRATDVSEGSAHRHKQEYYDAIKEMRDALGQDINVPIGEFAVAAVEADEGNTEPLEELFDDLASE